MLTALEPVDAEMAALMLARARTDRRRVTPVGSGSKRAWTVRADDHLQLSLTSLLTPVHHYAGDLVATLPAGMTLAAANAHLARARQWLPLDPAYAASATIGGIVSANDSGPRRHRFGAPRDLIVGIEVALADGRVVRAGGRVVKNVAGYDLSRLFCGSMGALGVITSATFKLAPLPAASRTVVIGVDTPARAADMARAIDAMPVTPTALEIASGRASSLLVRFETTAHAADHMANAVVTRFGGTIVTGSAEDEAWQRHHDAVWQPHHSVVKASVLPTSVGPLLDSLAAQRGVRWTLAGRGALGVLLIALDGDQPALATALGALRTQAAATGGTVHLQQAPASLRAGLEPARVASPLDGLRHAVKSRFDPDGVLPELP